MSQEEVRWGTRVSSCILGWWKGRGGLRLGIISLTTYPKQLLGPTHPPPGTGPYSPLGPPVPSLCSSNFCKVLPYMELKTASVSTELPGQPCRDSREGPRAPCSPFCLGLASPLGCGLGTLSSLYGTIFGTCHLHTSCPGNSAAPGAHARPREDLQLPSSPIPIHRPFSSRLRCPPVG